MIQDLLGISNALVTREPGRPKQTSLRRAVSSAYYAVFHAISKRCTEALITTSGGPRDWDTYALVYRSLDHAGAKRVFLNVEKATGFGAQIVRVGEIFVRLQDARLSADYDPRPFPATRSATRVLVSEAQEAIELVKGLPRHQARKLAAHLLAKRR
jgi:hypothetical protein